MNYKRVGLIVLLLLLVLPFVYFSLDYPVQESHITSTCNSSYPGIVSSLCQQSTLQYNDTNGSYAVNIAEAIYE